MNTLPSKTAWRILRKQGISLLLVCCLVLSLFVTALASEEDEIFPEDAGESAGIQEPDKEPGETPEAELPEDEEEPEGETEDGEDSGSKEEGSEESDAENGAEDSDSDDEDSEESDAENSGEDAGEASQEDASAEETDGDEKEGEPGLDLDLSTEPGADLDLAFLADDIALFSLIDDETSLTDAIENAVGDVTVTIDDNITITNTILVPAGANVTLESGAGGPYTIFWDGSNARHLVVDGELTLQNVTINGDKKGGGIIVSGGKLTLETGSVITKCGPIGSGGGVALMNNAVMIMNDGEISYNTTGTGGLNGGGISVTDSELFMYGGKIAYNESATGAGVGLDYFCEFTMDGGSIEYNKSSGRAGGVNIASGAVFTMESGTIANNSASDAGGGISMGLGSHVSTDPTDPGRFIMNGGVIESNTAAAGGGISAITNGQIEITDGIITQNRATSGAGGGVLVQSPMYQNNGVSFTMTGGEISYNQQSGGSSSIGGGGGIYVYDDSRPYSIDVIIESTGSPIKINNNNCSTGKGGGIMLYNAGNGGINAKIENVEINDNKSGGYGGGICIGGKLAKVHMQDASVNGNEARYNGGGGIGMFIGSQLELKDSQVSNNMSLSPGAGIGMYYGGNGKLTAENCVISNNTTEYSGGGIGSADGANNTITIIGGEISHNKAPENMYGAGYGGGFYIDEKATLTISDSAILRDNAAAISGGAIFTKANDSYNDPLAATAYANITTDGTTIFQNNSASQPYEPPSNAAAITGIGYAQTSIPSKNGWVHPLNNHDINYEGTPYSFVYDVVYNANGGTGSHTVANLPQGSTYTVLDVDDTGITRVGYAFKGWNTAADGSSTPYQAGNTFPVTADVTLYAQWNELYVVTFDSNGGTPATIPDVTVQSGEIISAPNVSKVNYALDGWYIVNTNTKWDFNDPVTSNLDLEARWIVSQYIVTFDSNGGTPATIPDVTVQPGNSVAPPAVSKTGYTLDGWYIVNTNTKWNFSDPVNTDLDLVAEWKINQYTVSFDADGGSPTPGNQTITYGEKAIKPSEEPKQRGYNFDGWYYGGILWEFDNHIVEQDMTLTAHWSAKSYQIIYYLNDGTDDVYETNNGSVGDEINIPGSEPTRADYTFLGWSTSPNATTPTYKLGGKETFTMPARTLRIYGVWRPDKGYTITTEHYQYTQGDKQNAVLVDTEVDTVDYGTAYTASSKSYTGYVYMPGESIATVSSVTAPITLQLYYMKAEGYQIVYGPNVVDGETSLEVLDHRIPDAVYTWEQFLDHIQPKLLLDGKEVTGVTFTSANFSSLNLRELTRSNLYDVEILASFTGGSVEDKLKLNIVDTTPPLITVATNEVNLSVNQAPKNLGELLTVIQPKVSDNYDVNPAFTTSFINTTFEAINWSQPNQYILYIESTDSSGNTAQRELVIIKVTGGGGSGGGNSGGGTDKPDELDRNVVVDDDGVPLGFYVQNDDGSWTYIDADDVPLGTLPQTGDTRKISIAVTCMVTALAILAKKKIKGAEK